MLCRVYVPKEGPCGSTNYGTGFLRRNMDRAEEKHIAEMNRLKDARERTTSEYLKRDYTKAIRRMENELREYRRYKQERV